MVYSNATTRDIGGLTINVRDVKSCGMSFYDGYKELASSLMSKIQQKEAFITMDSSPKITELKNEMISRFPSLKLQLPSLPNDSKSFRFDWLTLFDYYKCHAAHDAPIDDDMIIHKQTVSSFMLHRFHIPVLVELCSNDNIYRTFLFFCFAVLPWDDRVDLLIDLGYEEGSFIQSGWME